MIVFAVPSAYRAGIDWFVERRTDEMLGQIQPVLDDLARRAIRTELSIGRSYR